MPEKGFLISFLIYLLLFRNFFPRLSLNGNRDKKFFSLFFGLSTPILAKNNSAKRFVEFLIFFFYFFRNFLSWAEYERNSGLKFFFLFLGLSHPVLAKNNNGTRFFSFLNFFPILFGIFFPASSMNGIREKFFFLSRPISSRFGLK